MLHGVLQIDGLTVGRTFWHFICQAERATQVRGRKGRGKGTRPPFSTPFARHLNYHSGTNAAKHGSLSLPLSPALRIRTVRSDIENASLYMYGPLELSSFADNDAFKEISIYDSTSLAPFLVPCHFTQRPSSEFFRLHESFLDLTVSWVWVGRKIRDFFV